MRILKCLLLSFLLFLPAAASAEEGVIVKMNDGSEVGFAFSKQPKIITADSLQMVTTDAQVQYPYANVQKVYWGEVTETPTAISTPKQESTRRIVFRITESGIEASGLWAGERVTIYGVDGTLVTSGVSANDGGSVSLQLGAGRMGAYIVRTSKGVSYKFIKR